MTDTLSRHCHKKRRPFHVLVSWIIFAFSTGCASVAELDRAASIPAGVVGVEGAGLAAPMTLPRFLGVDVCAKRTRLMGQIVRERVAVLVPALEPKPVALPLSHPANAGSLSPTIAAAHKVHHAKAAKAAKIKAIAVLASEGCVGEPLIEEGLLAALDDSSADVRVAAVEAIVRSTVGCDAGCGDCCSEPIRGKLTSMVFEKNGPCCWAEPNSKARRLARLALDSCGGPLDPGFCGWDEMTTVPAETPPPEIINAISHD